MAIQFGYIFTWEGFRSVDGESDLADQFLGELGKSASFKIERERRISSGRRWQILKFASSVPLLGEERDMFPDARFYYRMYCRINKKTGTIILAAPRYLISDAAVQAINISINPNIRRKIINIKELSEYLLGPEPQSFAITYYMADVPGYGSALNTIALYGDDIAAANFLAAERANFTARQIGIRPTSQRAECGRFGNTGSIQFRDENIEVLEEFLAHTYSLGFYID